MGLASDWSNSVLRLVLHMHSQHISGSGFRDVSILHVIPRGSCGNRMRLVATNIVANLTQVSTRSLTNPVPATHTYVTTN